MKGEKFLEGVIGGVAFGFTAGLGFILAQRTVAKFGTRRDVIAETSEMIGGVSTKTLGGAAAYGQKWCKGSGGKVYECGKAR